MRSEHLLDRVFKHGGDESGQVRGGKLQARVRVDFDEPRLEVLINHKVVTVDFKRAITAVRVHLSRASLHRIRHQLFHLGHNLLDEVAFDVDAVQVLLELRVGELHKVEGSRESIKSGTSKTVNDRQKQANRN